MSEKPEIAHKMQFSIPKLLIIIGIVINRAELFQVELANKKVCLYNCKLQFIGEFAAVGMALTKTFLHSPLMLFEPSAIPLWYIWSYENKFSRPYMP